jgi:hypothetical protein
MDDDTAVKEGLLAFLQSKGPIILGAKPVQPPSCVALYDFHSEEPGDLHFRAGDRIQIISKDTESQWWYGQCNGATGIFPSNYVEEKSTAGPSYDYVRASGQEKFDDPHTYGNGRPQVKVVNEPHAEQDSHQNYTAIPHATPPPSPADVETSVNVGAPPPLPPGGVRNFSPAIVTTTPYLSSIPPALAQTVCSSAPPLPKGGPRDTLVAPPPLAPPPLPSEGVRVDLHAIPPAPAWQSSPAPAPLDSTPPPPAVPPIAPPPPSTEGFTAASKDPTRTVLLSSIESFKKTKLKKTVTNDRSAPITTSSKSAASRGHEESKSGLGGLFAGGIPKLHPTPGRSATLSSQQLPTRDLSSDSGAAPGLGQSHPPAPIPKSSSLPHRQSQPSQSSSTASETVGPYPFPFRSSSGLSSTRPDERNVETAPQFSPLPQQQPQRPLPSRPTLRPLPPQPVNRIASRSSDRNVVARMQSQPPHRPQPQRLVPVHPQGLDKGLRQGQPSPSAPLNRPQSASRTGNLAQVEARPGSPSNSDLKTKIATFQNFQSAHGAASSTGTSEQRGPPRRSSFGSAGAPLDLFPRSSSTFSTSRPVSTGAPPSSMTSESFASPSRPPGSLARRSAEAPVGGPPISLSKPRGPLPGSIPPQNTANATVTPEKGTSSERKVMARIQFFNSWQT